ncbi:MAG TPA: dTDP-4-amino-4,6-dideoxygalactose transaminase [Flavipsychrobacter sp.]|nr:dTDP-4-amino-4,6-dideoxygalactose transaminase [Flavipsychrobacter sp.]
MSDHYIGFNKPYLTGKEYEYIARAVSSKKLSGNGKYTQLCQKFFEQKYGFGKCLLTTSCTDALEMAAILLDIKEGDEVIIPSYTFVSTANAFVLKGAKIVFADSMQDNPNIDAEKIEELITDKTKAIVLVHYAGISCDMDRIMDLAEKHNLFVVEDAAQAIDSYYTGKDGIRKPLGSIGHLAAFSFHETKNIISGEGGMLVVNNERFSTRAEIIWEKGTNRSAFFRGEVDKYNWVDIGSSFLPSEVIAAFLFAQLENITSIQKRRKEIWNLYYEGLQELSKHGLIKLPQLPDYATNNAHMFYLSCNNLEERDALILALKRNDILSVFHYVPLHKSPYYLSRGNTDKTLRNSERYADTLLRLPFYMELKDEEVKKVTDVINAFYKDCPSLTTSTKTEHSAVHEQ